MVLYSQKGIASRYAAMGYQLPFSIAQLRAQALQRFRVDMLAAGLNEGGIPDDYIATPCLTTSTLSMKALLASWGHPGIEEWSETRIANTKEDAWECQGVTHDSKYWYFTQRNEIFARALPLSSDGTVDRTQPWGSISKAYGTGLLAPEADLESCKVGDIAYDHFGSPCYFDGQVYVPLEPTDKTSSGPALIVSHLPGLNPHKLSVLAFSNPFSGQFEAQRQAGWVAINPVDRCIYTSMQCKRLSGLGESGSHVILVYSLDELVPVAMLGISQEESGQWGTQFANLDMSAHVFKGFFPAASFNHYEERVWAADYVSNHHYRSPKFPLDGIAGGVFDAHGRLFLSLGEDYDDSDASSKGRVCCYSGFDGMPLGCRVAGTGCSGWGCEAEGLTMWNGELFLVTLHNGYYHDNMNFQVLSPPGFPAWTSR